MVRAERVLDTPFGPHCGLHIFMKIPAEARSTRQVRRPVPIPPPLSQRDLTEEEVAEAQAFAEKHATRQRLIRSTPPAALQKTCQLGIANQSIDNGVLLWRAGAFHDAASLLKAGFSLDSPEVYRYLGRGAPQKIATKPSKQKSTNDIPHIKPAPAGYNLRAKFANSIAAIAAKIAKTTASSTKTTTTSNSPQPSWPQPRSSNAHQGAANEAPCQEERAGAAESASGCLAGAPPSGPRKRLYKKSPPHSLGAGVGELKPGEPEEREARRQEAQEEGPQPAEGGERRRARALMKLRLALASLLSVATAASEEFFAKAPEELTADLAVKVGKVALGRPDADAQDLEDSAKAAVRIFTKEAWQEQRATSVAWAKEALEKGASVGHKVTNAQNKPRPHAAKHAYLDPQKRADGIAAKWGKMWLADAPLAYTEALAATKGFRENALLERNPESATVTPQSWQEAAGTFKVRTAKRPDHIKFTDLAEAEGPINMRYVEAANATVQSLALPLQTFDAHAAVIPKKLLGERIIAIVAAFAANTIKTQRQELKKWDFENAIPGDTAAPGKNALQEIIRRRAWAGAQRWQGKIVIQVLWDIAGFFDSIDVPVLVKACSEGKTPLTATCLALQLHRAARTLLIEGVAAKTVQGTGRSILAGCSSSTSLARAILGPVLARIGAGFRNTRLALHVDDVSATTVANNESDAILEVLKVGLEIAEAFRERFLSVSPKTTVTASTPALARKVVQGFAKIQITTKTAAAPEDLGAPAATLKRREAAQVTNARLHKASLRASMVRWMRSLAPGAGVLFTTGVWPQAAFSHASVGTSPKQRSFVTAQAVAAAGLAGIQPCSTSLIWARFGPDALPEKKLQLEQLAAWIQIWRASTNEDKVIYSESWRIARLTLQKLRVGERWAQVSEPIGATIVVLLDAGWHPILPQKWFNHDKTSIAHIDDNEAAEQEVLGAFAARLDQIIWRKASQHHGGGGLETGPPTLDAYKTALRILRRLGEHTAAAALDVISAGGAWCGTRSAEAHHRRCTRCWAKGTWAEETPEHRYYGCPCNAELPDPHKFIAKGAYLQNMLHTQLADKQCLWARGLTPAHASTMLAEQGGELLENLEGFFIGDSPATSLRASQGQAASDGSGGSAVIPAAVRKAGAGAAIVAAKWSEQSGEKTLEIAAATMGCARTPGRQTVPRAELRGAKLVFDAADLFGEEAAIREVGVDASYVTKPFLNQKAGRPAKALGQDHAYGRNGNLWLELRAAHSAKGSPDITKVKAHLPFSEVLEGKICPQLYLANALADAAAQIASSTATPATAAAEARDWHNHTLRAALRAGWIESLLWEGAPNPFGASAPANKITETLKLIGEEQLRNELATLDKEAGHKLIPDNGWVRCARCLRRKRPHTRAKWITLPCGPAPKSSNKRKGPTPTSLAKRFLAQQPESGAESQDESEPIHAQPPPPAAPQEPPAARPAPDEEPPRNHGLDDEEASNVEEDFEDDTLHSGNSEDGPPDQEPPQEEPAPPEEQETSPRKRPPKSVYREQRRKRRSEDKGTRAAFAARIGLIVRDLPITSRNLAGEQGLVLPHFFEEVHGSHRLIACGGFVGCVCCGSVASSRLAKLSENCAAHIAKGSENPIKKLLAGKLPAFATSWPDGGGAQLDRRPRRLH